MKLKSTIFLIVFSVISTALAGAFIEFFNARSEGENVRLEWKVGDESALKNYVIERKTPQSEYMEIASINPKGNNSVYSYLDESVYKANDIVFIYRLKIVADQISYTEGVSVTPSVSGVKRTWGSIKAMFR
jgi:hypothetical protein